LEREERLLLEAINAATAGSALTAPTEDIKKAERALELATDRYMVGVGTQIDVLNAQTALTEARGSYIDALRTYSAARATLVRAPGKDLGRRKP
jgi:outer membrane protein